MKKLALFAVMSLIWGLTWAAIRIGLDDMPPLLLAALRYILAAALLAAAARGAGTAFTADRAWRTVASALLVNTATYGLLFWGMRSVPSGLAGLVNLALIPIMLFALAAATGEERLGWRHAIALVIGCLGLMAIFWTRLSGDMGGSGLGLAAIVLATACYCLGSVVARPLVGPVKPLALTMVQAAIGGSVLLTLSLLLEPVTWSTILKLFTPAALVSLLFLSVLGTIVAYTIYLYLLREWGTVRAGLYAFVSPIVALAAGATLFRETFGWPEVAGAVLLLAAAAVALVRPGERSSS